MNNKVSGNINKAPISQKEVMEKNRQKIPYVLKTTK